MTIKIDYPLKFDFDKQFYRNGGRQLDCGVILVTGMILPVFTD
jgi:hypothetical protein